MLDSLPANWKRTKIGDLLVLQYGTSLTKANRKSGVVPVYGSAGIVDFHNTPLVDKQSIVIGRKGSVGTVFLTQKPFYAIDTTYFVELKQDVDWVWLKELLIWLSLGKLNEATGVPGLNRDRIYRQLISLPPLSEQQRIAEILTSVDDSIRATEAVIAQAERVKRGLMEDLLTGGLGSAAIARGEVPEGWVVRQVGELAHVKGGKRMPKGANFSEKPTPYPYVRVSDFEKGSISKKDLKFVCEEHQAQIARYTIGKDDIYISIAGTLGVVGLVPDELDGAQLTENAAKIVLKDDCETTKEYLAHILQSEVGQLQIHVKKGVGGGVPKLALFRIAEINIPIPSLQEQDRISRVVGSIQKSLSENSKVVDQLKYLKRGLMDDLLTGRVRTV